MIQPAKPRAFISSSLRDEDRPFVDWVERIALEFGFDPIGPVGKNLAAPRPIHLQMKEGIKNTDCMILVATPRYVQQDLQDTTKTGQGISELLHVEVGMASMADRPVLAFVKQGTDVGGFLPQAVQYRTRPARQ